MSKKTCKFKTEVRQLLDLVIHSLYSKKEIFLRELISNASDAIDRARFEALTAGGAETEWKIRIVPDREAKTLTISDNGIGMTAQEIQDNIGTIANSGTRRYLEQLQEAKDSGSPELIGQFGVGFYAAYMVADKVTVVSRSARAGEPAVRWISSGESSYTLEETERAEPGTDVTLHLREDQQEFLDEWRLRQVVKAYSDYIAFPIVMPVKRTKDEVETVEEETLNSRKAIWRKSKGEIGPEEYKEFYHHVSHDTGEPLETVHYHAEGATEFRALLFIPAKAPMDLFMPRDHHGVHLYVKNVFITDQCKELLPEYLRFVRGVVDSSDLPLNVSREILQDDAIIRRIRKSIVGKVLNVLAELKEKEPEKFLGFFKAFGTVLKEGIHSDFENKDKLKDLLLFPSTRTDKDELVSLKDYVGRMAEGQDAIYYLTGEHLESMTHAPHLEAFRAREIEVLLLADPIDDWVVQGLNEYEGKSLKPVDRANLEGLGSSEEREKAKAEIDEAAKKYAALLERVKESLKDEVADVRLSPRLKETTSCLVRDEHALNPHMERLFRSMNPDMPESKRILELNPSHPLLDRMQSMLGDESAADRLGEYIDLVYDQALLGEGAPVRNPQRFASLVSRLMVAAS